MNKMLSNFDNSSRQEMSILYYNDDMLIEILLWLPAKSLIKFKLVCKQWRSLISTDQFCHLHTLRHPKPQPSLILEAYNTSHSHADNTSHFFYFDPILNPHKIIPYTFTIPNPQILSSCKGMLLLQSDEPQKCFYVYNPTTRRSRKISLTDNNKYVDDLGLSLVFDPSRSSHYKIVCVRSATNWPVYGEQCCQIEVYDSQSKMWNPRVKQFTTSSNFLSSGDYWKNVIYFYNYPLYQYFDIDNYVIGDMPPEPEFPPRCSGVIIPIQESNGHLYHIRRVSPRHGDDSIEVYELQVVYSQWLIKYQYGLGQLPQPVVTMWFIRGDDGYTCTLVYHVSGKIMAYRFLDKITEELVDLTDQPFYPKEDPLHFDSDYYQFGESMAPV